MLGEVLNTVPYGPEHENVWSPRLTTVLLEACSQLDSLWRARSHQATSLSIKDYFDHFGPDVADRWLVFWGEPALRLQPFSAWARIAERERADYQALDWWKAYNALKHDRLKYRKDATLRNAVHALAGLFVAIVRSPECAAAIAHDGWIPSPGQLGIPAEDLLADESPVQGIVVETRLISYGVQLGWNPGPARHRGLSVRSGSYRFQSWCAEHGLAHW